MAVMQVCTQWHGRYAAVTFGEVRGGVEGEGTPPMISTKRPGACGAMPLLT